MKRFIFLILAAALLFAGCSASGSTSGAVGAVDRYYQAIIAQNADQLKSVTCAEFLETAQVEFDSFMGVKTELQGFSCQEAGKEGSASLVKCSGKIVATYGSDKMDFPIGDRVHNVQEQNGSWKVCGY
jgi:hypothetical protein